MAVQILLINLERDNCRLAHMRGQCARLGLTFERFAAVRGADLPDNLKPYFDGADTLSPGEIGCYASHLAAFEHAAAHDGPTLVLEDDVDLPDDFRALLDEIMHAAPAGWDMVRLTSTPKRAFMDVAALAGGRRLVRNSNVPGATGAYLVSPAGARKFLRAAPRFLPVDQDLKPVWAWGLNIFGVAPTPVRADIFEDSSIDAMAPAQGARKNEARLTRLRLGRLAEAGARHAHVLHQFGFARWLWAEAVNLALTLTPRGQRPALLMRAAHQLGEAAGKQKRPGRSRGVPGSAQTVET